MKFRMGDEVVSVHSLIAPGRKGTVTEITELFDFWPYYVDFGPEFGCIFMAEDELRLESRAPLNPFFMEVVGHA